jgi:hypothetical protein
MLRAENTALRLTMLDVATSDNSDSNDHGSPLSALLHLLLKPTATAAEVTAAVRCMLGLARVGSCNVMCCAKLAPADERIKRDIGGLRIPILACDEQERVAQRSRARGGGMERV